MQVVDDWNVEAKPSASFIKKIGENSVKVDVFTFNKDHFSLLDKDAPFLDKDEANPRINNDYTAISNADLDLQIINKGQISEAIGRYTEDSEGNIKFDKNGFPIISILDGSRRFDCCYRNDKEFTIIVGRMDDDLASSVIRSCVDSQKELGSLELGILINDIEIKNKKEMKSSELSKHLPYEKSRFSISHARRAFRLYSTYPKVFSVFPVISLVGKKTISKLDTVLKWAEDNYQIDTLMKFLDDDMFNYESKDSLLTFEELQSYTSKHNTVIVDAMIERIGFKTKPATRKITTEINPYVNYELKLNNKPAPRSEKLAIIEAELTDEELIVTQRFLKLVTEHKNKNSDMSITDEFEMLFRQIQS